MYMKFWWHIVNDIRCTGTFPKEIYYLLYLMNCNSVHTFIFVDLIISLYMYMGYGIFFLIIFIFKMVMWSLFFH